MCNITCRYHKNVYRKQNNMLKDSNVLLYWRNISEMADIILTLYLQLH